METKNNLGIYNTIMFLFFLIQTDCIDGSNHKIYSRKHYNHNCH